MADFGRKPPVVHRNIIAHSLNALLTQQYFLIVSNFGLYWGL
jgi:hypothetical protein